MQILVVLAAFMGVLLSVRAAAVLPVEDRSLVQGLNRGQDLSKLRKELILKLVSSLLEGPSDTNLLSEMSPEEADEPLQSRLEERAVYNRLSLPQRDRKAPCKNFFWKTFTSC
ncbi:cortistatin [Hippocampus zosterae]|uniref:cortistatin n=1 Tax=Hippocampus zosterae TaxID=109293 RepID=UPI00223E7A7C|nr:cortistatin [Hippocampus zosterae]